MFKLTLRAPECSFAFICEHGLSRQVRRICRYSVDGLNLAET